MTEIGTRAIAEVVRMHDAIEGWVTGRIPETRFEEDIAAPLSAEFRIIEPKGRIVLRDALLKGLFEFRGRNPRFRIVIEEAEVVVLRDGFVLVSYIERQTGAARAAATNARRSTCLLDVGERVNHLFLHETWIEN